MILRRLLSLCLVASMLVTSGAMAALRGSSDGAQTMVICTGMGPQVITIGADGTPLAPAPICPDCTMALEAGPLPPLALAARLAATSEARSHGAPQAVPGRASHFAQPRAPPALAA